MTTKNIGCAFEGEGGLFLFDAEPVIEWPVQVRYPVKGGRQETKEILMELVFTEASDIDTMTQELMAMKLDEAAEVLGSEKDPLFNKVRGWKGLGQVGRKDALPCDAAGKKIVLANALIRNAIVTALIQMATGAEVKNFETPPAPGLNRKGRRAAAARMNGRGAS